MNKLINMQFMINTKTDYYKVNDCDGGSLEHFCSRRGDCFFDKCVPQWNTAYIK